MFDAIFGNTLKKPSGRGYTICFAGKMARNARAHVRAQSGLYRFACARLVMASGLILGRLERA